MVSDEMILKLVLICIAVLGNYFLIEKIGEKYDIMWLVGGSGYVALAYVAMVELEVTTNYGLGYVLLLVAFIRFLYNIVRIFTQKKFSFNAKW